MLKVLDAVHILGEHLLYKNVGRVGVGCKTDKIEVTLRSNGSLIGFVKWKAFTQGYCFFPLNWPLSPQMLEELSLYCATVTKQTRSTWKPTGKQYYAPKPAQTRMKFDGM